MLIITGYLDVEPDRSAALVAALENVARLSQAEEGCQDYVFMNDPLVPGRVRVVERWESDDALKAHFAMPHFAEAGKILGGFAPKAVEILKYEISAVKPLR